MVWSHTHGFKIEQVHSASSIWNLKYDVTLKFHDPKFNCRFYYYIHFEIAQFNSLNTRTTRFLVSTIIYYISTVIYSEQTHQIKIGSLWWKAISLVTWFFSLVKKYHLTNQKPDKIFFTSENICIGFSRLLFFL